SLHSRHPVSVSGDSCERTVMLISIRAGCFGTSRRGPSSPANANSCRQALCGVLFVGPYTCRLDLRAVQPSVLGPGPAASFIDRSGNAGVETLGEAAARLLARLETNASRKPRSEGSALPAGTTLDGRGMEPEREG